MYVLIVTDPKGPGIVPAIASCEIFKEHDQAIEKAESFCVNSSVYKTVHVYKLIDTLTRKAVHEHFSDNERPPRI